MKRLLIITQRVDAEDQLLGFFIGWLWRFARYFDTVTVICQSTGAYDLPENVRVWSLGKDAGVGRAEQLFRFYRLLWAHRHEYNSVFVHMNPIWAVVGSPLWRLLGKRVFLWYTHKAVTLRLRLAVLFVHGIFTASKESFRISSGKVIVTGHGIDTELFSPDDSVQRVQNSLLTVGRIAPVKNLEVLVDASAILLDDGVPLRVEIVGEAAIPGDKEYETAIRNRIAHTGYADRYSFAGKLRNSGLVSCYRSHDVFVHTSKTGSLDKAILEAMACGMKVVSCNDASRAFLPVQCQFSPDDAKSLSHVLAEALQASPQGSLRQYVTEHHSLDDLIVKLSSYL